jgi:K+-sensing histidine kinase KdpD
MKDLELLNELLAGEMTHDIKNFVYSIAVDAHTLAQLADGQPRLLTIISRVQSSCVFAMNCLANVAEIGELENHRASLRKEWIEGNSIASIFERHCECFYFKEKNISVIIDPPEAGFGISADRALLDRIFQNLIANAARYTPSGGQVRVSFSPGSTIHISNTAEQIPENCRTVLFEKFAPAVSDRSVYAKGLGLYYCKLAMDAQGGEIAFSRTENENRFSLIFKQK